MKKILLALTVIASAAIITPKFIGSTAQQNYQTLFIQQLKESGATIKANSYELGWFSSKAVTEFIPAVTAIENADKFVVRLASDIQHGPFYPTAQAAKIKTQASLAIDGKKAQFLPINIITDVAFSGDALINIASPEIKYPHPASGDELIIAAFKGQINYIASTKAYDLNIHLPRIHSTGTEKEDRLNIDSVKMRYHAKKSTSGLLLGDGTFSIQDFFVGTKDKPVFALKDIAVSGALKETGQYATLDIDYKINSITAIDDIYKDIALKMNFHNIMSEAILALQKGAAKIQQSQHNEQEKGMAMLALYMEEIPKIMKGNPGFTIKELTLTSPDGTLTGQLTVDTTDLGLMDMMGGMGAILHKVSADGQFSIPEKLLLKLYKMSAISKMKKAGMKNQQIDEQMLDEKIKQQVNALISKNFMTKKGDLLQSTIKIMQGKVSINGQSM